MSDILPNFRPYTNNPTNELEHDNFILGNGNLPVQLVTSAGTDFPIAFIEETIGNITYRGEILNPNNITGLDSPQWLLSRTIKMGNLTRREFQSPNYDSTWSGRHSAFPPVESIINDMIFQNNTGMVFDGISECVAFPDRMYRDNTEKWSFAFWFKPRVLSNQTIFSRLNQELSGRQIAMTSTGKLRIEMYTKAGLAGYMLLESKPDATTGLELFAADRWHHVVITIGSDCQRSSTNVFVNGVEWIDWTTIEDTATGTGSNPENPAIAYFGKSIKNPTWFLDGVLDEVVIVDNKWDATQANYLWNAGVPANVYDLINASLIDAVRYWFRMGDGTGDVFPYCTATICNDSTSPTPNFIRGTMINMSEDNYTPEAAI
jgi:hypothetical protein